MSRHSTKNFGLEKIIKQQRTPVTKIEEQNAQINIKSIPPKGKYKVTNIYVNELGKLIIDYDDNPV